MHDMTMNTPAPMSDEQLSTMRRSAKDSPEVVNTMWHLLYAQAIIAARDAQWSEMLGEPYGIVYEYDGPFGMHQSFSHKYRNGKYPDRAVTVYAMHKNVEEIDTSEKRVQKSEEIKDVVGFGKVLGTFGVVEQWPDTTKEVK
jgi:hypothetical protein